jgi:hypothetical protein
MRTITQTADDLNVSRKKIYNEIENLSIQTQKDGRNNYLPDDDFERIKSRIQEQNGNTQERTKNVLERDRDMIGNNISDREYTDLKERISFLEDEIKIKNEQINAKDYQLNGLIQSNFAFSKSLPIPQNLNQDESAVTDITTDTEKKSWFKRIFKKTRTH